MQTCLFQFYKRFGRLKIRKQFLKTIKKVKMKVFYLEGNIASGKSLLLQKLKEKYENEVNVVYEPLYEWQHYKGRFNLLDLMYKDSLANGLAFQIVAQITQLERESYFDNLDKPVVVFERSLRSQIIFVDHLESLGKLRNVDYWVLQDLHRHMNSKFLDNYTTIYLRTSPEISLDRIRERGRIEENSIDIEYTTGLHNIHEKFFKHKSNCVIIDGDENIETVFENFENVIFTV